jgi:hypothetical protein
LKFAFAYGLFFLLARRVTAERQRLPDLNAAYAVRAVEFDVNSDLAEGRGLSPQCIA